MSTRFHFEKFSVIRSTARRPCEASLATPLTRAPLALCTGPAAKIRAGAARYLATPYDMMQSREVPAKRGFDQALNICTSCACFLSSCLATGPSDKSSAWFESGQVMMHVSKNLASWTAGCVTTRSASVEADQAMKCIEEGEEATHGGHRHRQGCVPHRSWLNEQVLESGPGLIISTFVCVIIGARHANTSPHRHAAKPAS